MEIQRAQAVIEESKPEHKRSWKMTHTAESTNRRVRRVWIFLALAFIAALSSAGKAGAQSNTAVGTRCAPERIVH
jgi:hypothetical protein